MSAQAQQVIADRQAAMRALLGHPLLTAARHREALALVRVHTEWLREWFGRNCGWTLQVDAEQARLRKTPADHRDGSRGARDSASGLPFSRRRYALFCLALAALERGDRQTTLGNIADEVSAAVAGQPGFAAVGLGFDLAERESRRDLVHVVRLLLELRVLVRLHGQEEHFVERRGDVLYNLARPAMSALLAVRRAPSSIPAPGFEERLAALLDEPAGQGEEARNRHLRHRLMRRLLDDPVVYYDGLDRDERAYLVSQRPHLLRLIEEATGLVGEVRREGIALVDPEGSLTDLGMPEQGTEGHVALLVAEFLAQRSRAGVAQAAGARGPPGRGHRPPGGQEARASYALAQGRAGARGGGRPRGPGPGHARGPAAGHAGRRWRAGAPGRRTFSAAGADRPGARTGCGPDGAVR